MVTCGVEVLGGKTPRGTRQPGLDQQLLKLGHRDPVQTHENRRVAVEVRRRENTCLRAGRDPTLKVASVAGLWFPHAAQAIQVTRRVRQAPLAHRHGVRGHQPDHPADKPHQPGRLAARAWGIEALHHLRDVTDAEDAWTPRAPAGSRA